MLAQVSSAYSASTVRERRLLQDFGRAVATCPFDCEGMAQARSKLGKWNHEVVLEAACTAAFFELITKLVGASHRPSMGVGEAFLSKVILIAMGWVYHLYLSLQGRNVSARSMVIRRDSLLNNHTSISAQITEEEEVSNNFNNSDENNNNDSSEEELFC